MLPRLLAALVVVAAGFLAAFFIGRATADSAEPNSTLRAGPGSVSVVVLPRKSPAIALPAKAGALPPLVQPPATTTQQPTQAQPTQATPTIGVG